LHEDRIKHLEFIQNAIGRMAGNSFLLKGWSVTLAAALVALAAKDTDLRFSVLALIPPLIFWGLDAYYLRLERLFRALYDDVRRLPEQELLEDVGPFSLSVEKYSEVVDSWFKTLSSGAVIWLHGTVVVTVVALLISVHIPNT
jgi:hypothetical protein